MAKYFAKISSRRPLTIKLTKKLLVSAVSAVILFNNYYLPSKFIQKPNKFWRQWWWLNKSDDDDDAAVAVAVAAQTVENVGFFAHTHTHTHTHTHANIICILCIITSLLCGWNVSTLIRCIIFVCIVMHYIILILLLFVCLTCVFFCCLDYYRIFSRQLT